VVHISIFSYPPLRESPLLLLSGLHCHLPLMDASVDSAQSLEVPFASIGTVLTVLTQTLGRVEGWIPLDHIARRAADRSLYPHCCPFLQRTLSEPQTLIGSGFSAIQRDGFLVSGEVPSSPKHSSHLMTVFLTFPLLFPASPPSIPPNLPR